MAWNNQTNTSVGQIWTSAKVNETYDNLRYLKGQAGTVAIENNVNFGAATPSTSTRLGIGANGSGARTSYIDLAGDDTWGDGLRMIRDAAGTSRIVHRGTADFQLQTIEAAAMWFRTNSALRGGWSAAGDYGIGNTAPQGRLHVTTANGGSMHWDTASLGGTPLTVLSTGTVANALTGIFVIVPSAGSPNAGSFTGAFTVTNAGAVGQLWNSGGNIVALSLSAGAATLTRTSGILTYRVAMWITWI